MWTPTRQLIAGATVDVDPLHAQVVYLDPPNAQGLLAPRAGATSTGPSGLFAVYTDTITPVRISANGASSTVMLGATDDLYSAAIVVLQ